MTPTRGTMLGRIGLTLSLLPWLAYFAIIVFRPG
jgi:hypothetical protein